ncbi:hypothetical protein [Paenibacillus plantarum]|uniref:hypothetical protein n=1 Tax=Paenibacillus plantarum TaxID=2654975 RepID=UPI001492814B|nr:hypothetical protein [Paenibacillus plantarum]
MDDERLAIGAGRWRWMMSGWRLAVSDGCWILDTGYSMLGDGTRYLVGLVCIRVAQ